MNAEKTAYICGPLTELTPQEQVQIKMFYAEIADMVEEVTGVRAFVPHEHYDPILHANFTPTDVYQAEHKQVCENTSILIVVAIAPSWGGGIEVAWANEYGVPAIILCERQKFDDRKISRLLQGVPAIKEIIPYTTKKGAIAILQKALVEKFGMARSTTA